MKLREYIKKYHYNSQTHFSKHTKIPTAQINRWLKEDCYHIIDSHLYQKKRKIIMFKQKLKE